HQFADEEVQHTDVCNDRENEHQHHHDERCPFIAAGGDDLFQFGNHLPHESNDRLNHPREHVAVALAFRFASAGTHGARGVVGRTFIPTLWRKSARAWKYTIAGLPRSWLAGQEVLEPSTAGFGDRCAANCATALRLVATPEVTLFPVGCTVITGDAPRLSVRHAGAPV